MEYRACASSYVAFGVIFGLLAALSAVVLVVGGQPSLWQAMAVSIAALLVAYVWLWRFRLTITADTVTYGGLFVRERRIARSEIVSASFAQRTGRLESPLTFVIRAKNGAEIRVNAKVFSRAAVQALGQLDPSAVD